MKPPLSIKALRHSGLPNDANGRNVSHLGDQKYETHGCGRTV